MELTPVRIGHFSSDQISYELTLTNCLTSSIIKEGEDFMFFLNPLFFCEKKKVNPSFFSFESNI